MKTPKLIKKLKDFLDSGKKRQQAQMASIKVILKKLKQRELDLKQKLANEKDKKIRKKLQKNLKIVTTQRKKGLCKMRELKC